MRILILGVSGMLGRALWQILGAAEGLQVYGAARSRPPESGPGDRVFTGIDVLNADDLTSLYGAVRPDVVINAIGLIKQRKAASDPLQAVPINTLLPHRLAALCRLGGARLIHVSTDCVFRGDRGGYRESDPADAVDLYGLSKYLGEVSAEDHVLTLRTSIIGRERGSAHGLIEWFLNAPGPVKGFRHAIFSGLPTVVLAELIRDRILPRPDLHGLFHVSADPIDKLTLLGLTAEIYGLNTVIDPVDEPRIDRSLNSDLFRGKTGFSPLPWPQMLGHMRHLQG
jgi:dTDP-4-dehydrorhamnose reductase